MDLLLGAAIGLVVICVMMGIIRGTWKILVSLVTTAITIAVVLYVTPYVSDFICRITSADQVVERQVEKTLTDITSSAVDHALSEEHKLTKDEVEKVLKAAGITEEKLKSFGIEIQDIVDGKVDSKELAKYGVSKDILDGMYAQDENVEEEEVLDIPKGLQSAAIESSSLPHVIKEQLLSNNVPSVYEKLGAETFLSYVAKFISNLTVNIAAFLFSFFIVSIILRAIIFALDAVSELPTRGFLNRLGGAVLGVASGLIVIWVLFLIVTAVYTTSVGKNLMEMIQQDPYLSLAYEYNPLMRLLSMVR